MDSGGKTTASCEHFFFHITKFIQVLRRDRSSLAVVGQDAATSVVQIAELSTVRCFRWREPGNSVYLGKPIMFHQTPMDFDLVS